MSLTCTSPDIQSRIIDNPSGENRASAVNNLPGEILAIVFRYSLQIEHAPYAFRDTLSSRGQKSRALLLDKGISLYRPAAQDTEFRTTVACVCRYWKNILQGDAEVWSHVYYAAKQNPAVLKSWIARAGNCPLRFTLCMPWETCHAHHHASHRQLFFSRPSFQDRERSRTYFQSLFNIIKEKKHRVQHFEISSRCSIHIAVAVESLPELLTGKILTSVLIEQRDACLSDGMEHIPTIPVPRLRLGASASTLQVLTLNRIPLGHTTLLFPATLIALDISFDSSDDVISTWTAFYEFMSQMPLLVTLRLNLPIIPVGSPVDIPLHLERLRTFEIGLPSPQGAASFTSLLLLPKVQFLSLSLWYRTGRGIDYSDVLRILAQSNSGIVSCCSNITSLIITSAPAQDSAIQVFLNSLNVMENLVLCRIDNIGGTGKLLGHLLQSCFQAEMRARQGLVTCICCPKLRHLETFSSRGKTEYYLSEARRRCGLPITYVTHRRSE